MPFAKGRFVPLLGILVAATFPIASGRGSTIRDDEPDSSYLALAASPEYAAVGSYTSNGPYSGSGVLIAPDWVLLAAHELFLASSGTFTINGASYTSTQLIANPNWSYGNNINGYDFGLVHLSSPVSGVTPATLYTGSSEFGQVGTYVGFGLTGTGLTGYQTSLGIQERAFQNVIDGDFGNPSLLLGSDFDNPNTPTNNVWGDATPLTLEGCVSPGDSGGGMFITEGGQTYLAGVISFVAVKGSGNANSVYGDLSGAGRVSALVPWILSTIPEPSAATLLAGAGLILLLGRQGRNKD
jgi:Trypsin